MNIQVRRTKIFAVLSLIFASSYVAHGQGDSPYVLRAGTRMQLEINDAIGSSFSSVGDTFRATLVTPFKNHGIVVLPAGTVIEGRILKVSGKGSGGRNGKLEAVFETIIFTGGEYRKIDAAFAKPLRESSQRTRGIVSIVGGTLGGALIGGITRSSNGALIGAGLGAAAGTGTALLMTGKDVGIKSGEEFEIELKSDVTLPIREV